MRSVSGAAMMPRAASGRRWRRAAKKIKFGYGKIKEDLKGKRGCARAQERQFPEGTPVLCDQVMDLGRSARSLGLEWDRGSVDAREAG
jgi:hypothetical protein